MSEHLHKKKTLIQYKTRFKTTGPWYDYSASYDDLKFLRKELKYLNGVGYKTRIIEREIVYKEKVIE